MSRAPRRNFSLSSSLELRDGSGGKSAVENADDSTVSWRGSQKSELHRACGRGVETVSFRPRELRMGDGEGESEGHDVFVDTRESPSSPMWLAPWLAGATLRLAPEWTDGG